MACHLVYTGHVQIYVSVVIDYKLCRIWSSSHGLLHSLAAYRPFFNKKKKSMCICQLKKKNIIPKHYLLL